MIKSMKMIRRNCSILLPLLFAILAFAGVGGSTNRGEALRHSGD